MKFPAQSDGPVIHIQVDNDDCTLSQLRILADLLRFELLFDETDQAVLYTNVYNPDDQGVDILDLLGPEEDGVEDWGDEWGTF
jgi:hypothetical protein